MRPSVGTLSDPDVERLHALEEKFKSMDVRSTIDLEVVDMCLIPWLVIPQIFKVPYFDMYNKVIYPHTHLRAYFCKMEAHIDNDKLLIHHYQDSLSGASLEWNMQLERSHV